MNPWRATIWSVNLLLVGAIAYAAAIMTSHLIERGLETAPAPVATERRDAPRPVKRGERPLSAYRDVLEQNVFGARRSTGRPVRTVANAPEPSAAPAPFRVTLTGTFLAGDESFAMIIAQGEREERLYRVGDCVPAVDGQLNGKCDSGQARLAAIELQRIVVTKGGERIPIEIGQGKAEESPRITTRDNVRDRPRSRLARERSRVAREDIAKKDEGEEDGDASPPSNAFPSERVGNTYQVTVPNAEVEKAFENFSEVVAQAAAVPIIQDGQAQGFQLRKVRPGSIFARLGLKNNDLIKGVNGESLTTADQALRLFTLFQNEKEIVLDVKRRDEDLIFAYTVE